jgi:hypothetical protein
MVAESKRMMLAPKFQPKQDPCNRPFFCPLDPFVTEMMTLRVWNPKKKKRDVVDLFPSLCVPPVNILGKPCGYEPCVCKQFTVLKWGVMTSGNRGLTGTYFISN